MRANRTFEEERAVFDADKFPSLLPKASYRLFPGLRLERKRLNSGGLVKTEEAISAFRVAADEFAVLPCRHVNVPFPLSLFFNLFLLLHL
jgi:hypothetical protein